MMLSTAIVLVLLSVLVAASFIAAVPVQHRKPLHGIGSVFRDVLSSILHTILLVIYPIKDWDTASRNLPAVPFKWPGGNGDEAKFLHGPSNSTKWAKAYGPIYRIWSGINAEVVVTCAEDIKVIFHDSDRHIKAKNNDSGWLMGEVLGQCVGLLSQAEWFRLRSCVEGPFLHKQVLQFLPTIQNQTKTFYFKLFEWKASALTVAKARQASAMTIDAVQDTKMLPFLLVATLLYGDALSSELLHELEGFIPDRERLFQHVVKGGLGRFWWSAYLPTEANRLLERFQAAWLAFNRSAYERARKRGLDVPIVSLWAQMEAGEIDRKQLLQTLDEIMFANLDVTTGALSWLLVNLASHPRSQSQLYTELITSLRNPEDSDPEAFATYINTPSGTYLSWCVAESARVRPIAAFSVPQAAPTTRHVAGYRIPAGTSITVDSYALNIRNPFWGDDGAAFRPERWADLKPSETRYQAWRFGFGPRNCMGKYLAEKILRVALVQLVRDYDLSIEAEESGGGGGGHDGGSFAINPDSWITHPDVRIACRPRHSSCL